MPSTLSRLLEQLPTSTRKREEAISRSVENLPGLRQAWDRLANADTEFLSRVAVCELASRDASPPTMTTLRVQSTRMCVSIFAMLRSVREMSTRDVSDIEGPFRILAQTIHIATAPPGPSEDPELVVPLALVNADNALTVGYKAALLGNVRRLRPRSSLSGWRVPDGFVITAEAYRLFMAHQGLADELNRLLQIHESATLVDQLRLSSELQQRIITAPLPDRLQTAVRAAYRELESAAGHRGVRVVLRPSCVGEAPPERSFTGQHRIEVNVGEDLLLMAYKEVLASQYGPAAMSHRRIRGLRVEDQPMAVVCSAMVDTMAAGQVVTRHSASSASTLVHVLAVPGLAKAVFEGYVQPDEWEVSRESSRIIARRIVDKPQKFTAFLAEEGVSLLANPPSMRDQPALEDERIVDVARLGMELEAHCGGPLCMEWALSKDGDFFIQQLRHVRHASSSGAPGPSSLPRPSPAPSANEEPLLAQGTESACPGLGAGRVFVARTNNDLLHVPEGSVLVVARPLRRWSGVVPYVAAVVVETGGEFSHLASIAREFQIPVLCGVHNATTLLQSGQDVVVDATNRNVLAPPSPQVALPRGSSSLNHSTPHPAQSATPAHATLATILSQAAPLSRVNPLAPRIMPENVRSLRDAAQASRLLACRQILKLSHAPGLLHHLAVPHPLNWWVLDLDDPRLEKQVGRPSSLETQASAFHPVLHPVLNAVWTGIARADWTLYANSPRQFRLFRFIRRLRAAVRPLSAPRPRIFILSGSTTLLNLSLERALFTIQIHEASPTRNALSFLWQWFPPWTPLPDVQNVVVETIRVRGFFVDHAPDGLCAWSTGHDPSELRRRAAFLGALIGFVQRPKAPWNLDFDDPLS
ncbi:PEP/pyruvate-binding domain-containing protein [Desulfonatronum lacustre]|uniref:PEP/pyruvate-binding domain-containing protein n=1 Tax=Desulfonatronum lacustre TaxID=66849 RepID=UPI000A03E73B|nr:PEP/pyruvate-binding domain-containing protein [Desulfonatronum lacustre]